MALKCSPPIDGSYAQHRAVEDAGDTPPIATKAWGMNMQGFRRALVQVVPSLLANPDISILFWSPAAAAFIAPSVPLAYSGAGAGVPYEVDVPVEGRIMFVLVGGTVAAADTVDVYVAGADPIPS